MNCAARSEGSQGSRELGPGLSRPGLASHMEEPIPDRAKHTASFLNSVMIQGRCLGSVGCKSSFRSPISRLQVITSACEEGLCRSSASEGRPPLRKEAHCRVGGIDRAPQMNACRRNTPLADSSVRISGLSPKPMTTRHVLMRPVSEEEGNIQNTEEDVRELRTSRIFTRPACSTSF